MKPKIGSANENGQINDGKISQAGETISRGFIWIIFCKAIKGPCPWTEIMPTGGVSPTEESLKEWFGAGVTCVGIGSQLITKEILKTKNYRLLEEKTRFSIETIRQIRS